MSSGFLLHSPAVSFSSCIPLSFLHNCELSEKMLSLFLFSLDIINTFHKADSSCIFIFFACTFFYLYLISLSQQQNAFSCMFSQLTAE